ncbi:hypothetical protein [Actinoplanes lutulentus]|uniref:hypothetical protein n=1 Tax=Actinoplanes lutulentus TaxID=1287878 RepID=UPI001C65F144|nr:hypothetical protein [Actinoplanes lutulentus]
MKTEMDPTSSPDNTRPSPGLARFWQVRPDPDGPAPASPADNAGQNPEMVALGSRRKPEPPETPADLLNGYGVRPAAPLPPVTPADPFGLNRAARRSGPRTPAGGRPFSGPPARDPDHSGPTDDQPTPDQDVKSHEPEAGDPSPSRDGAFGGFRLGGTGRFLFGNRSTAAEEENRATAAEEEKVASEPPGAPESGMPESGEPGSGEPESVPEASPEPDETPVAEVAEPGDSLVAEKPAGDEPDDATPADEPVAETPADADQDAADRAGPSDENGREDMNGRAGAPGYAQTGEASGPDGTTFPAPREALSTRDGSRDGSPSAGDGIEEQPVSGGAPRTAAGWATVPSANHPVTPTSGNPANGQVSGIPVSPGFAYPPVPGGFTPDHPAAILEPVSGAPHADAPEQPQHQSRQQEQTRPQEHEEPAAQSNPTSGAPVSGATVAAIQFPTVQIPATRTPPDLTVDRSNETASLPSVADGGFGFGATGYSLGRSGGEAFGVASVTPAAPGAGSVTPPPAEFPSFPFPDSSGVTGISVGGARRVPDEDDFGAPRRSASLEDVEPVRRTGRRSSRDEESPAAEISRTVWDEDAARHFRAAWHEVKAEFVDDPVNALTRAHDLLTDAVNELTEVLLAERDDLDPLRGTGTPDTESMRMAMRNYREFLERILSL